MDGQARVTTDEEQVLQDGFSADLSNLYHLHPHKVVLHWL